MSLFKYKARNKDGEIYEKTVEAPDRLAIYGIIRGEGGTVISIAEIKKLFPTISFNNLFGSVKTQEKINFAKSLASMADAGLSVTRALGVMSKQSKSPTMKGLLIDLESEVSHGSPLSEALAKHSQVFSSLFVSMVKAGEESGSVSESLKIVANQMEKSYLLVKKVRGAMIYPVVIIGVMIILAILLLVYMVPTLTETFKGIGVALPLPTRILIYVSDLMVAHTVLIFGILVVAVLSAWLFWRSNRGRRICDVVFVKIPVVGEMVKEVQVARTARTLSSLLSSGVEIVSALEVTRDVLQNHLYKDVLTQAHAAIQKGEALSVVFEQHEDLYPVFVSEMAAVGEETGKTSEMFMGIADYYEGEVDQKTKDISTIIEPVLMVIIGAGVGLFAISMLAPTYSLVDYI